MVAVQAELLFLAVGEMEQLGPHPDPDTVDLLQVAKYPI